MLQSAGRKVLLGGLPLRHVAHGNLVMVVLRRSTAPGQDRLGKKVPKVCPGGQARP